MSEQLHPRIGGYGKYRHLSLKIGTKPYLVSTSEQFHACIGRHAQPIQTTVSDVPIRGHLAHLEYKGHSPGLPAAGAKANNLRRNKKLFYSMSVLLDLLLAGMDQPQADQPNSLAEGLPVWSNLI
eukprot:1144464-Pelagomonas_calceolata.AAC.5